MDATQFQAFMNVQQKILEKMNSSVTSNNSTISVGANTALIPNFEALDTAKESFRNYKLRFENYTQMKGIHTNKQYCANLLLNSIGSKNFSIVTALAAPANPNSLEYEELMKLLQEHLSPQQNVLVAQHQFLSKYQEDLSIAEYVAKLRADIGDCEFYCKCKASVADIFLRAQFIRGIKDNFIREQLLQNKLCELYNINKTV